MLRMTGVGGSEQHECIQYHRSVHLKMVKMANFMLHVFYYNIKKKAYMKPRTEKKQRQIDKLKIKES